MKVRNGFVTNSSSSSFIIAIRGGLEGLNDLVTVSDPVWKEFIVNGITALMKSNGDSCGGDTSSASKLSEGDINDSYEGSKLHGKLVSLQKDGFVIYNKHFDYSDPGGHTLAKIFKNNNNFLVISED